MTILLFAGAAVVLVADILATVLLFRGDGLDAFQRGAQLAFVWLFPVVGAAVVIAMRFEDIRPLKERRPASKGSDYSLEQDWSRQVDRQHEEAHPD